MPTYAIGDIQGCYKSFKSLLSKIQFNPRYDRLWLAGDMINRGPDSLATMQFILEHQQQIQVVLGNHDLHFLAVAGNCQSIKSKDTFDDILNSTSKNTIVTWMKKQPLAYFSEDFNTLMVHAGLPFNWSLQEALNFSGEVSITLQSPQCENFFLNMYDNLPDSWDNQLKNNERLRYITNALTRMRYCSKNGRLELTSKQPPGKQPSHLVPWFTLKNNQYKGKIVFGHWASLEGRSTNQNIIPLDTGCVWGGQLTAVRLDDNKVYRVNSSEI